MAQRIMKLILMVLCLLNGISNISTMKIFTNDNEELTIEDSWQDECPNCGDTDADMHYIPNWVVHRCYPCLVAEAKKFYYIIEE